MAKKDVETDRVDCRVRIGLIHEDKQTHSLGEIIRLPRDRAEARAQAGTVDILVPEPVA
jgi:hypothetical protein